MTIDTPLPSGATKSVDHSRYHPHDPVPTGFTMQEDFPSSALNPGEHKTLTRSSIQKGIKKGSSQVFTPNCELPKVSRLKDCGPMRPSEVQSLMSHATRLLQEFPLVKNLDAPIRSRIPELLGYIRAPAGTVLFEETDEPDRCYITLSGEVAIIKENFSGDMFNFGDGTPDARKHCVALARLLNKPVTESSIPNPGIHRKMTNLWTAETCADTQMTDSIAEGFGIPMAILGPGTMFGERGLLENSARDATVVAKVTSEFLIIERDDFDSVLKKEIRKTQVKQMSYVTRQLLADVPFFMKLSPAVQDKIPDLVHHLRKEAGTVLFREGDPPDLCYIVLAGEVNVWKKISSEATLQIPERDRRKSSMLRKTLGSDLLQARCTMLLEGLIFSEKLHGADTYIRHDEPEDQHDEPEDQEVDDRPPLRHPRSSRRTITEPAKVSIIQEPGEHLHHRSSTQEIIRSTASSMLGGLTVGFNAETPRTSVLPDAEEDAEDECDNESEVLEASNSDYGTLVSILGRGSLFGELALLEDQPRSATIVCRTSADFLVIERADFEHTLKKEVIEAMSQDLPRFVQPLLSDFAFFQKLDERVVKSVPQIMTIESETAGSVLFWEGDPPGRCYIILSGVVAVWKADSQQTEVPRDVVLCSKDLRKKCANLVSNFFPDAVLDDEKALSAGSPDFEECRASGPKASFLSNAFDEAMGSIVAYLGPGLLVGEDALIEEKPRNATITCEQDCYFLTIEKKDFDNVLLMEMRKARVRQLGAQVLRVLRDFEVFSELDAQVQEQLPEIVRYASSPAGTTLFEQGSPPTMCYVILAGEVMVWKASRRSSSLRRRSQDQEALAKCQAENAEKGEGRRSACSHDQIHHGQDHHGRHGHHDHDHHSQSHHGHHDHRASSSLSNRCDHDHLGPHGEQAAHHPDAGAHHADERSRIKLVKAATDVQRTSHELPAVPQFHDVEKFDKSSARASLLFAPPRDEVRKSFKMPPSVGVSNAVRARCLALAAMLAQSAAQGSAPCMPSTLLDDGSRNEECIGIASHGQPVAALGPGIIFGELALLSDHPRDATVTCREDCEFLVIDKVDFDRTIKSGMKQKNDEKLDFLRKHAPIMKYIGESTAESILRFFEKVSYPLNHHFLKIGQQADGSIYFVWKGSVECKVRAPGSAESVRTPRTTPKVRGRSQKREEFQKCGVLLRGSVFGAVVPKVASVLSIVAVSSPCEVLRISAESVKQLPDSVLQGFRESIDREMQRRIGHRVENHALDELLGGNTPVRPSTSYLRQSRAFMHLPPGADLPRAMHLGRVGGATSNTPRCRLPAVHDSISLKAKETTLQQSRRRSRALRSIHDNEAWTESRCTSPSQSRASSRSQSRRPSQAALLRSPSRSKSPSRSELLAESPPFVHINDMERLQSRLISKAGKQPRYELMFDVRGAYRRDTSPTSTRASTPRRPGTSMSVR